jgi:hypothetical protein
MVVGTRLPPPDLDVNFGGGGGSEWVQLTVASNDIDAHLLTGRLSEIGIETQTKKDPSAPGAWLYGGSDPWGPVIVYVRRYQLEDARIVLAEIAYDAAPAPEMPNLDRPRTSPLVWWMAAIGLGALLTGVALEQTARSLDVCDLPLLCGQAPSESGP